MPVIIKRISRDSKGREFAVVEKATGAVKSRHTNRAKAIKARNLRNALNAGTLKPSKSPTRNKQFIPTLSTRG